MDTKNLNALRRVVAPSPPGPERAALSVVWKLLGLRLGTSLLTLHTCVDPLIVVQPDMYHPLLSCYAHDSDASHATIPLAPISGGLLSKKQLFHLPLPIFSLDEVTVKLMSTFLLYSMVTLSTTFSSHVPELEEASVHLAKHGNL